MTKRERAYAELGIEYAEGIDSARVVALPSGREARRTERDTWEVQPRHDDYWKEFPTLIEALRFAVGAIGPDPIIESVRSAMESRGLNARSLAALTIAHDPSGKGLTDTGLRQWLTGRNRLTTERAGWVMAALGIVPVQTGGPQ